MNTILPEPFGFPFSLNFVFRPGNIQFSIDHVSGKHSGFVIISPDESRGYTHFCSFAPLYVSTYVRDNSNSFMDFFQMWHTHVLGSGEEPCFKVSLNSQ